MEPITIRSATAADALRIASIHCENWRDIYADVLDPDYLAGPIEQERRELWLDRLTNPSPAQSVLVADMPGAGPVGFICLYRDQDPRWGSLIDNLHVAPGLRGQAIGKHLMRAGAQAMLDVEAGAGVHLWVFEANTAGLRFYERLGGSVVERCLETELPAPPETYILRVFWSDLAALTA
ncbi:MAG: GNAT family N-acetyltransferase [Novosphingobium sp.]|uniref:GNAT family N-acetyltransferase n=1 Tax=Novosphingobium sp. TaxID=1874826 RepID=UPI00301AB957